MKFESIEQFVFELNVTNGKKILDWIFAAKTEETEEIYSSLPNKKKKHKTIIRADTIIHKPRQMGQ